MLNFCLCVAKLCTSPEEIPEPVSCNGQSEQAVLLCVQTIRRTALGARWHCVSFAVICQLALWVPQLAAGDYGLTESSDFSLFELVLVVSYLEDNRIYGSPWLNSVKGECYWSRPEHFFRNLFRHQCVPWGSTVCIKTSLLAGRPWNRGLIIDRGKSFSRLFSIQVGSGAIPASCRMWQCGLFRVPWSRQSFPSSAEV
jgi:hypothetical protein